MIHYRPVLVVYVTFVLVVLGLMWFTSNRVARLCHGLEAVIVASYGQPRGDLDEQEREAILHRLLDSFDC